MYCESSEIPQTISFTLDAKQTKTKATKKKDAYYDEESLARVSTEMAHKPVDTPSALDDIYKKSLTWPLAQKPAKADLVVRDELEYGFLRLYRDELRAATYQILKKQADTNKKRIGSILKSK